MTANTNNKNSAKKKLIPAVGMLVASAMALTSTTYAWFTMSREVEVTNIQMTASVPEDIQISLGHLTITDSTSKAAVNAANAKDHNGLAGNEGKLTAATGNASADDGGVMPPNTGADAVSMLDWSNTADISEYYRLGRIIPASSTTGANIYFTPDAAGNGKSLKTNARFYQAASIDTAFAWDSTNGTYAAATSSSTEFARTTLHAIDEETKASDVWGTASDLSAETPEYKVGTEWNVTNDDGYYVDIPVWIRTSNTEDTKLAIDAYVTTNATVDEDDLYLAARAAVIYSGAATVTADNLTSIPTPTPSNLIKVRQDTWSGGSIVDFMYSTNSTGDAVNSITGTVPAYANATEYNATTAPIKLAKSTGAANTYGTPTKAIIRVWLEGEDPNCWNQNAGQNFNICLKFVKADDVPDADIATAIDRGDGSGYAASGNLVQAGDTLHIDTKSGTTTNHLVFTYNGTNWNLTDGSFFYDPALTYKYNNVEFTNTDKLAEILDGMDITKATATGSATTAITIEGSST